MSNPGRLRQSLKLVVLTVLAGSLLLSAWTYSLLTTPTKDFPVPHEFSIPPGSSLRQIASKLSSAGMLPNDWSFLMLAYLMGQHTAIKAGNFELTEPLSPMELLNFLIQGRIKQYQITFIEGRTFAQWRQTLNEHPAIRHDSLQLDEQKILRLIEANAPGAEGLFFPDTYFFKKNDSDIAILKRAYHIMQAHLETAWRLRQPSLPLSNPYEGLVLASIIEKETSVAHERNLIAGVFINRLRLGMRLQTDPTVIYGLGDKFDGNLRKIDLQTDHPYNTYTRTGLPPTPIAMPSLASIQAAFNPADTKAIYFVARGDGTSYFSTTLAEHNRAVTQYQKTRNNRSSSQNLTIN
ncbi:endolytic transglycosylase MltG [Nitrosomonas mobilis]|uniref:Endolytic murein transglycosylase n=1 Tax=Nitrosomonas mobilis TaxID=51642 RepID=A0A1G5SAW3_9PROT|nr:endolytic transglycosylase MltG [Nitrosomonas mobilis]SCZ84344.1 Aminodeoxychorismate lyase [Nitrosomonas mobilis]